MKKIITPAVREEAEYICDVTGKPAVASLIMTFDYGSRRDTQFVRMDLCDEAADEVIEFLRRKCPHLQLEDDLSSVTRGPCPLCGRRGRGGQGGFRPVSDAVSDAVERVPAGLGMPS